MPKKELVPFTDANERLKQIAIGVAIILWVVLTHIFTWPFASAISRYSNNPLLSYSTMVPAIIIAAIVAFVIVKLVFPYSYRTASENGEDTASN